MEATKRKLLALLNKDIEMSSEMLINGWLKKNKKSLEMLIWNHYGRGRAIRKLSEWGCRASLVAQWLRIRLPMQGTQVQALVWEDPTCRRATKTVHHNYWARVLQQLKPMCLEPVLRNKRSHRNESPHIATNSSPHSPQLEKASTQQWRPNTAKNKINFF